MSHQLKEYNPNSDSLTPQKANQKIKSLRSSLKKNKKEQTKKINQDIAKLKNLKAHNRYYIIICVLGYHHTNLIPGKSRFNIPHVVNQPVSSLLKAESRFNIPHVVNQPVFFLLEQEHFVNFGDDVNSSNQFATKCLSNIIENPSSYLYTYQKAQVIKKAFTLEQFNKLHAKPILITKDQFDKKYHELITNIKKIKGISTKSNQNSNDAKKLKHNTKHIKYNTKHSMSLLERLKIKLSNL